MPALIVTSGRIRVLQLITTDMTHIGFGKPDPSWPDQLTPDPENVNDTELVDVIGYAKITTRGWLVEDLGGSILSDGVRYSISLTPTTIAYVQAEIPSGTAEGVLNGIGQIGVFGEDVSTNPSNATWADSTNVLNPGTMFRIQHLPIYIKPPNTLSTVLVIMPLLA